MHFSYSHLILFLLPLVHSTTSSYRLKESPTDRRIERVLDEDWRRTSFRHFDSSSRPRIGSLVTDEVDHAMKLTLDEDSNGLITQGIYPGLGFREAGTMKVKVHKKPWFSPPNLPDADSSRHPTSKSDLMESLDTPFNDSF